jgi:exodeoxyribonuclease-1
MADTFFFYDTETSGLNRAFDQILEFAAIRTDLQLNELERFKIRIRLRPDVIPSPSAILVNRIRADRFMSGPSEYAAIQEIHAQVNRPGTTSIGYNSIGFDDEFLRFSFYRNLLPPYTHQYANHCRRMDLLPITIVYWLYRSDAMQWPVLNGKASLKLEDIGMLNGLFSGQSHDAMSDVEAALRLARVLFRDQKMWHYLDGCFCRDVDAQRAEELPVVIQGSLGSHLLGLMTASEFGTRLAFQVPVLSIGNSVPYPKQTLWLRLDLPSLRETRPESVADTTWVARKRFGEPAILLPPHARYLERIDPDRRQCMQANLAWLESHAHLFETIIRHHRRYRYPFVPDLDADAGLYQSGFFAKSDEALCREFHAADLPGKIDILKRFTGGEARCLAARVLFRNFPGELPDRLRTESDAFLERIRRAEPMLDFTGTPRRSPQSALSAIRQLRQSADPQSEQSDVLADLECYIKDRFNIRRDEDST